MKTTAMIALLVLAGCSKPAAPAPEVAKSKPAANLVECPACSNGCAQNADTCPKCGYSFVKARIVAAHEKAIAEQAELERIAKVIADEDEKTARQRAEAELMPIRACEKTAIEATDKIGGRVTRGANGVNVLRIDLAGTKANLHTLRDIDWSRLDFLVWLNLSNTEIDDRALKELADLQDIGNLDLRGSKCTQAGFDWAKAKWPRATIEHD